MCLIIQRDPDFEIPYDKFESGILTNPDGYGLSYPDQDGKLVTIRSAEKADPEKLYRLVNEELIDNKILVHFRYTTAGATNLRNAHPFPILERAKDGIDLRMAHNGTLFKYKPTGSSNTESDTRVFVKEFVRPLFKRLIKGMDPEELLNDPFTKRLLEDQLTNSSVLTFIDGNGNVLLCNEEGNGGKREDKWYYSNTYSFNPTHREPSSNVVGYKTNYGSPKQTTAIAKTPSKFKCVDTKKFSELMELGDITDTFLFTDMLLDSICEKKDLVSLMVKELMYELQRSNDRNETLTSKLEKAGEKNV